MTLHNLSKGNTGRVLRISLPAQTARRLEMLGLTAGTDLTLLNKKRTGAVIIKVRGTRFAVGREIAEGIEVGHGKQ